MLNGPYVATALGQILRYSVATFGVNFDLRLTQEISGSFNSESVAIPQGNACKINFFTSHTLPIYEKDSFRREDAKISSKLVSLLNDFIIKQKFW